VVDRVRGVQGVQGVQRVRWVRKVRGAIALTLVLCANGFASGTDAAQSKPQTGSARPTLDEDLAAITEFNRRYLQAINDEDIATLSSLTTEDHIMISSGRAPLVGKAANDEANGRVFKQFDIDETWTPVETVVSGDLAYQRGTFTVAATPRAGGNTTKTSGNFLRIYKRMPNGEWRMVRDMFNSVPATAPQK
jgi:ketosteroid isomerase-like protein